MRIQSKRFVDISWQCRAGQLRDVSAGAFQYSEHLTPVLPKLFFMSETQSRTSAGGRCCSRGSGLPEPWSAPWFLGGEFVLRRQTNRGNGLEMDAIVVDCCQAVPV